LDAGDVAPDPVLDPTARIWTVAACPFDSPFPEIVLPESATQAPPADHS